MRRCCAVFFVDEVIAPEICSHLYGQRVVSNDREVNKMKGFILGANYWASHAGTEMWKKWDEQVVDQDLKILSENKINDLRVFPLWCDFQPVKPAYTAGGGVVEYRDEQDHLPTNKYMLDEVMLDRFERFLDLCGKYDIKVLVGLITGWMSGRLFIPPALYEKNLYSDPIALMMEQQFVKGFVERFKDRKEIGAWDLGNECNCMMAVANRAAAFSWSSMISNAIRAVDHTRPVVSGMSSLTEDGNWRISDQAECVDILTTHPYPYWTEYASKDKVASIRTLLVGTAMNKYHSDIGNKPCLIEEIGTMGPMVCDDETTAAGFARTNLFSAWANGAEGIMWWCTFDQDHLTAAPYAWSKCELELGMMRNNVTPKNVTKEFKRFKEWLACTDIDLKPAKDDGIIIVTKGQEQWGVPYMSYILAKQAKANVGFAYCNSDIPESDVYLLPSISGTNLMNLDSYRKLMERVYNGATLYISNDDGFLPRFETFSGLKVLDSDEGSADYAAGEMILGGKKIAFSRRKHYYLESTRAEVLAEFHGEPIFTKCRYGQGTVFYLNYPLEKNMLAESNAFDGDKYTIYQRVFENIRHTVSVDNKMIGVTEHLSEHGYYVVLVNYSGQEQPYTITIEEPYRMKRYLYGEEGTVGAFDSCVLELD